ncbi:VG15 protein [Kitasatospora sp. NPDC054939]
MELAERHLVARRRTAAAAVLGAVREWRGLDERDLSGSWAEASPRLLAVVSAGQLASAGTAQAYTDTATALQGVEPLPAGTINPRAFAGIAADGRALSSLLYLPVIDTKRAIADGAGLREALAVGERKLRTIVDTEVADAGRAADGVGVTAGRSLRGYVRMISGGACGRCAVLAGREYAFNRGFQRHPHCHCVHVPIGKRTHFRGRALDSRDYFNSLTPKQQDRAFTVAGARAIRDGADVAQVVNARRGLYRVGSGDRTLLATREGMTRRGLARRRLNQLAAEGRAPARARLTPDAIYQLASDRDDAIRLLHRYGYLY